MRSNVRDKDLRAVRRPRPGEAATEARMRRDIDLRVLIPAFMISEIRRGFEIGFLIVLPFLVIDLIVATHHHGDGHDDAAADGDLAAVQDPVLRADRRLESARRQPGALVYLTSAGRVLTFCMIATLRVYLIKVYRMEGLAALAERGSKKA